MSVKQQHRPKHPEKTDYKGCDVVAYEQYNTLRLMLKTQGIVLRLHC